MAEHLIGDERAERLRTRASTFLTVYTQSHSLSETWQHAKRMIHEDEQQAGYWEAVRDQAHARLEGRMVDVSEVLRPPAPPRVPTVQLKPARQLVPGYLILGNRDVFRVEGVKFDDCPESVMSLELRNMRTQEASTYERRRDEHYEVTQPKVQRIEGAHGYEGSITIEPAVPPQGETGWVYRYTIKDGEGTVLDEDFGPTAPLGEDLDTGKALASTISFLRAAGEAYRYAMEHGDAGNLDIYPAPVNEWAYGCSDELDALSLELDGTVLEHGSLA